MFGIPCFSLYLERKKNKKFKDIKLMQGKTAAIVITWRQFAVRTMTALTYHLILLFQFFIATPYMSFRTSPTFLSSIIETNHNITVSEFS